MAELHVELVSVEREIWSGEASTVIAGRPRARSASCRGTPRCSARSPTAARCASAGRRRRGRRGRSRRVPVGHRPGRHDAGRGRRARRRTSTPPAPGRRLERAKAEGDESAVRRAESRLRPPPRTSSRPARRRRARPRAVAVGPAGPRSCRCWRRGTPAAAAARAAARSTVPAAAHPDTGGGWVLGGRPVRGRRPAVVPVFSLAPGPRRRLSRRDLGSSPAAAPGGGEVLALLAGAVVLECPSAAGPVAAGHGHAGRDRLPGLAGGPAARGDAAALTGPGRAASARRPAAT